MQQVFGGDKSKTRRVASLQSDVAALEAALESARAEYDRVLERNLQARPRSGRNNLRGWSTFTLCRMTHARYTT